jgi:hypothetical protein
MLAESIEHARRAFALGKFETAVEHYAIALELMYVAFTSSPESSCVITITGQGNTARMHLRPLTYIFHMGRHF